MGILNCSDSHLNQLLKEFLSTTANHFSLEKKSMNGWMILVCEKLKKYPVITCNHVYVSIRVDTVISIDKTFSSVCSLLGSAGGSSVFWIDCTTGGTWLCEDRSSLDDSSVFCCVSSILFYFSGALSWDSLIFIVLYFSLTTPSWRHRHVVEGIKNSWIKDIEKIYDHFLETRHVLQLSL